MLKATLLLMCLALGFAAAQQAGSSKPPPATPPSPKGDTVPPAGTPDAPAAKEQAPPKTGAESEPTPPEKPKSDNASSAKDPTATRGAYKIGPDDQLLIRVWQQPELSGFVTVGPDGTISLQLLDEVKVAGLTPEELKALLTKMLTKFIVNPEVNVQVARVNSRTYIIQGEVGRPGVYPLSKPLTVLEALVNGGGFREFANKKKIYILRGSQRIFFNYNDVSKGKHMEQNIEIQNGDQIFVP